jgi:hypothetical protein
MSIMMVRSSKSRYRAANLAIGLVRANGAPKPSYVHHHTHRLMQAPNLALFGDRLWESVASSRAMK